MKTRTPVSARSLVFALVHASFLWATWLPAVRGADVAGFSVLKGQQGYVQTDATNAPVLQGPTPYWSRASVEFSAPGTVLGATLRRPHGWSYPLFSGDSDWHWEAAFATLEALNAAFPDGDYRLTMNTVHDGTANAPVWTLASEQYAGINVGSSSAPIFADIDHEGGYDLFVGRGDGHVSCYRNTGSKSAPPWRHVTDDYAAIAVGPFCSLSFADIDGDGDLDLFVGGRAAVPGGSTVGVSFYRNDGTPAAPVWRFVTNAYAGASFSGAARPAFADIDGDRDPDFFGFIREVPVWNDGDWRASGPSNGCREGHRFGVRAL